MASVDLMRQFREGGYAAIAAIDFNFKQEIDGIRLPNANTGTAHALPLHERNEEGSIIESMSHAQPHRLNNTTSFGHIYNIRSSWILPLINDLRLLLSRRRNRCYSQKLIMTVFAFPLGLVRALVDALVEWTIIPFSPHYPTPSRGLRADGSGRLPVALCEEGR